MILLKKNCLYKGREKEYSKSINGLVQATDSIINFSFDHLVQKLRIILITKSKKLIIALNVPVEIIFHSVYKKEKQNKIKEKILQVEYKIKSIL